MISRHWTGLCKKEFAYGYIAHLQSETIPQLKTIEGFIDVSVLHRELNEGVEFLVTTRWQSPDALKTFTGESFRHAVIPDNVRQMMLQYDAEVRHYTEIKVSHLVHLQ